ncbi:MAG: AsmA family protein [Candidatus Acidiferrales bacterium]
MRKPMRYGLIVLAVVIIILLALPLFVSVNQFRPTIEQKLSAALGRQVQVGNLGLSIFSGSVSAADLSISDDSAFSASPFLTAKSLKIGVELMPLIFSHTLHITSLTIESPQVTLLHNPTGRWNFSSLAAGSASAPSASSGSSASSFVVEKLDLVDGQLTVGLTTSSKRSVYSSVDLEISNLSASSQFPIKLTANLPGGGKFSVTGEAGPLDAADAALTPLNAKLEINSLDLVKTGFLDPNAGVSGIADLNCTIQSASGSAEAQGALDLSKLQVVKGGAPASIPVDVSFDSAYDLQHNTGVIKQGSVTIGKAVTHLSGTYDFSGDTPAINVKLTGQDMPVENLESVLPAVGVILPKGATLNSGTLSTNLSTSGPTSELVTTGNIALANATLGGFNMGSQLAALSAFAGVSKAASGTTIEKLTSNVRVTVDGTTLDHLDMIVNGIGELTGGGTVSATRALDFKMTASLSVGGSIGQALGGFTGGGKGLKVGIPFHIGGTTSNPAFAPDMSSAGGSSVGVPSGANAAAGAIGGLFKKKKSQ